MEKQEDLIQKVNWNVLIILDACRYDYFKKVYKDYLDGDVKKVLSPATRTIPWLKNVFHGRYDDIVYVSANPYINSIKELQGFDAKRHFLKIIDVWNWWWDEERDVVHPSKVNQASLEAKSDHPHKRLIIHYIQPHAPYSLVMTRARAKSNQIYRQRLGIIG